MREPWNETLNLTHKIEKFNRKGEEGEKGMKYLDVSVIFSAAQSIYFVSVHNVDTLWTRTIGPQLL
jgi:hypothetical protein